MLCNNCGKIVPAGSRFCPECGAPQQPPQQPSAQPPQKKKGLIALVVVLLLCIPVSIFVLLLLIGLLADSPESTQTAENGTTQTAPAPSQETPEPAQEEAEPEEAEEPEPSGGAGTKKYYAYLDENEKAVYDAITECLQGDEGVGEAHLDEELTSDQFYKIEEALMMDDPYIGECTLYTDGGSASVDGEGKNVYTFQRTRDYGADREETGKVVKDVASSLSGTTEEKVSQINDYIIKHTDPTGMDESDLTGQTAYGALVDHKASCQGYSYAFKAICDEAGIECDTIWGEGEARPGEYEDHMWTIVKLDDGNWYEVDVLWNDMDNNNYLCLKTSEMNRDHKRNAPGDGSLWGEMMQYVPSTEE